MFLSGVLCREDAGCGLGFDDSIREMNFFGKF